MGAEESDLKSDLAGPKKAAPIFWLGQYSQNFSTAGQICGHNQTLL